MENSLDVCGVWKILVSEEDFSGYQMFFLVMANTTLEELSGIVCWILQFV